MSPCEQETPVEGQKQKSYIGLDLQASSRPHGSGGRWPETLTEAPLASGGRGGGTVESPGLRTQREACSWD